MIDITSGLIRAAFGEDWARVNVASLARAAGISRQRMGGYVKGEFPWPADVALLVMAASGKLRLDGEGLRLQSAVPPHIMLALKGAARQGFDMKWPTRKGNVIKHSTTDGGNDA